MGKLGEGLKVKYEPIWPQAPVDEEFHYYEIQEDGSRVLKMHEERFRLISSIEELKEFAKTCKDKIIGFDTETTGLTYGVDKIVGFSVSLDRWSGVYVPIRHKERLEIKKEVNRLDKDGNPVVLKSGKFSKVTETTYVDKESPANLDPKQALDILYEILLTCKRSLMHNAEFDLNMLKFEGYDITRLKFFDTLILPYLYDPEATALAGLKALEKRVLGRTVPEFKEVLGSKAETFAFVAPKDGYVYCCCDTSGVVGIYEEMFPAVKKLLKTYPNPLVVDGKPYDVLSKDNQMVKMFVDYYGHAKNLVNRQKAIKYKEQLEKEQKETVEKIYKYFNVGFFNLSTSSKEFKEVMTSKDVLTGVKTDKGGHSWGKKAAVEMKRNLGKLKECLQNYKKIPFVDSKLNKNNPMAYQLSLLIDMFGLCYFKTKSTINTMAVYSLKGKKLERKDFWLIIKQMYKDKMEHLDVLSLIHKNNSLNKALNSYVDKLTQVDECIMKYKLKGTKSGRLSSGNGAKGDKRKNHYYIDLNAQNLTKPASAYYTAEKCNLDDPDKILGWKFTPVEKDYAMEHLEDLYIVEGQDPGITIRGCIKAPEGRYIVSLDYDAEEYKTIAVLSQDTKMLDNFHKGIDPHTASAYAIWGEENYDKAKRKKAKIFNFLNNYDGGAHTLAQQLDIPVKDAQEMIDKYNETFYEMADWKKEEINKMYQNDGVVFTIFGRPRQFKGWINVINKNNESDYETLVEKTNIERASFSVKSAIERRVANHEIQGACGDILRLVLYRLYCRYFKNRNPHIDFLSTVHDEINYTIDKKVTVEYVRELEQIMTFDSLDKTLPIITSTDIGYSYGNMFPFVWEDDTKQVLIPKRVHHA